MQPLGEAIIEKTAGVADLYHRLALIVGPSGTGKTSAMLDLAKDNGWRYININLELSRRLLDLTEKQRRLRLPSVLSDVLGPIDTRPLLLDNIELLFDRTLGHDPLRLLQSLSRVHTLIVAWNGRIVGDKIVYADPNHVDYRSYLAVDLVIVDRSG